MGGWGSKTRSSLDVDFAVQFTENTNTIRSRIFFVLNPNIKHMFFVLSPDIEGDNKVVSFDLRGLVAEFWWNGNGNGSTCKICPSKPEPENLTFTTYLSAADFAFN